MRHMASVSGHPLVNIPDLRPERAKTIPPPAHPLPSVPKSTIASSQKDQHDIHMAKMKTDNGIDFVHVAMFIAGAAAAYISVVLALAITAAMLLILSKKQIGSRSTDEKSPSPVRTTRRRSLTKPLLEYQRKDDSITPISHRRRSQPRHVLEKPVVIPVSSRRRSIDSNNNKRTVDEEYAFRPYN